MATHSTTEAQPSSAAAVTTAAKHAQGKNSNSKKYVYHADSVAHSNNPPPNPHNPKRPPPPKRKSFESGSCSSSDQAHPREHGKGVKGRQPQQQKGRKEPPSLERDESPDPLLGEQVYVPYTDGVYPGVATTVVGGAGGGGESVGGTPRGKGDVSG